MGTANIQMKVQSLPNKHVIVQCRPKQLSLITERVFEKFETMNLGRGRTTVGEGKNHPSIEVALWQTDRNNLEMIMKKIACNAEGANNWIIYAGVGRGYNDDYAKPVFKQNMYVVGDNVNVIENGEVAFEQGLDAKIVTEIGRTLNMKKHNGQATGKIVSRGEFMDNTKIETAQKYRAETGTYASMMNIAELVKAGMEFSKDKINFAIGAVVGIINGWPPGGYMIVDEKKSAPEMLIKAASIAVQTLGRMAG